MDDVPWLERLHHDHAAAVRAYVRRRIGPEDADDVVADVFVVAWRRGADVPEEPRAWLLGIARKALGNRRRTARRQQALFERLAEEAQTRPAAATDRAPDGTVLRALARLSASDREALLLVTWDGLSTQEAGTVLGVRPGTVAMRVHRARRRLQQALEEPGEPVPRRAPPSARPHRPAHPLTTGDRP